MKNFSLPSMPIKTYLPWVIAAGCYCFFIALLSYWYPYTIDETRYTPKTFAAIFSIFHFAYTHITPRLFSLLGNVILYLGKWSFVLFNPLVQLLNVFSIFYLIYLRRPDLSSLKDLSAVVLIMLLSVFAVAQPDNTLFWIGGAVNYSWSLLPFLLALIFIKGTALGAFDFKDTRPLRTALFAGGIILGMCGETIGPASFILFAGTLVYMQKRRLKIPPYFYFVAGGLTLGLALMFLAPANAANMNTLYYQTYAQASFAQKLFWFLGEINDFIAANLFIPLVVLSGVIAVLRNRGLSELKNREFIFIIIGLILSAALLGGLMFVPHPQRAFYSSTVISAVVFVMLLKYLRDRYCFDFIKVAVFVCALCFLFVLPAFMRPYYDLHKQDIQRRRVVARAKQAQQPSLTLKRYKAAKGPSENLSIDFNDTLGLDKEKLRKLFGMDIIVSD